MGYSTFMIGNLLLFFASSSSVIAHASPRRPSLCLEIRNLGRIFLLDALDRLVAIIFHYPLLLEVFDLGRKKD